jgi:uncharacterized protein (TIGR02145 family)
VVKIKPVLFSAGIVLATIFTFSCSSGDDDVGGGNGGGGNGGGGNGSNTCSANFRTVRIGTQTWMAENLNCDVSGSKCYNNDPANCAKYGRLYNWSTAMNLPSNCNENSCLSQIQSKHRGICPSGWHIPSEADWDILVDYAGGYSVAGSKLKSTSGWNYSGNGTDQYGFSALPGGLGYSDGSFSSVGSLGYWWSASEFGDGNYGAYSRDLYYGSDDAYWNIISKSFLQSVRCVQD